MEMTLDDRVQAARDRALLISQQDADAPRLTERLDAQSLAVLVEAFDATRAHSAEVEASCEALRSANASLERERDEARSEARYHDEQANRYSRLRSEAQADASRAQADNARLRSWAHFGAWVFEGFWHDGEPGDLDAADAQEKAVELGLLGRTSDVDPSATHAEGCDYSPDAPATECCCFIPTRKPLDAAALAQPLDTSALEAAIAAEREACAALCDERETIYRGESEACESNGEVGAEFDSLADECAGLANAIRARILGEGGAK